jgi:hypothetical protein
MPLECAAANPSAICRSVLHDAVHRWPSFERVSRNVFHHQIVQPYIVQSADVGMVQCSDGSGFMAVPQRIASFFITHRCRPFCDECITFRLILVRLQKVQQATAALGATGKFAMHMGTCFDCGRLKLVVQYRAERPLTSAVG